MEAAVLVTIAHSNSEGPAPDWQILSVSSSSSSTRLSAFMMNMAPILAQIGFFCLIAIGIFIVAEILLVYAGYSSHRGLVLTTPSLSPVPTSELLSMAPLTVATDGMVFVIEAGGVEAIHKNQKVAHLAIKCFQSVAVGGSEGASA
ncbi:hypothetical protein MVEN_02185700 [Mycena venus]|uniref:Uncharacterized protein n=1 Tax=Mycena venus TaxID=2733690 RepID=A0A8H7CHQ4_9AGAR|nr:hypothetical protein MVEN_02185700 [Mycena venus]